MSESKKNLSRAQFKRSGWRVVAERWHGFAQRWQVFAQRNLIRLYTIIYLILSTFIYISYIFLSSILLHINYILDIILYITIYLIFSTIIYLILSTITSYYYHIIYIILYLYMYYNSSSAKYQ